MKGQAYDILEPFTEREKSMTFFHRLGTVSFITFLGLAALDTWVIKSEGWVRGIIIAIIACAALVYCGTLFVAFAKRTTRHIETIGQLVFYDHHLLILDRPEIKYSDIKDYQFKISDYHGQYRLIPGDNVLARPYRRQGGNNYFTVTTDTETITVRFRLKSYRGKEHLENHLKKYLKQEINTTANNR